jgi:hypothetical protein
VVQSKPPISLFLFSVFPGCVRPRFFCPPLKSYIYYIYICGQFIFCWLTYTVKKILFSGKKIKLPFFYNNICFVFKPYKKLTNTTPSQIIREKIKNTLIKKLLQLQNNLPSEKECTQCKGHIWKSESISTNKITKQL